MKKLAIFIITLIIILVSIICYKISMGTKEVEKSLSILEEQNKIEEEYTPYGYTIDNPNIIVNPFKIAPLSALIMFETSTSNEVEVQVLNKLNEVTYEKKYEKSKTHIISIYNLTPNCENKIILKTKLETKEYSIKIDDIACSKINDSCIIKDYTNLKKTSDDLYLATQKLGNLNKIYLIDNIGKIQYEYNVNINNIKDYELYNNEIYVLSNKLTVINKTTGKIEKTLKLENEYNNLRMDSDNLIISKNELIKKYDVSNNKLIDYDSNIKTNESGTSQLDNTSNYNIAKGISFLNNTETKQSKKKITTLFYRSIDKYINKSKIVIKKESNNLVFSGLFDSKDKVYIVLESSLNKKIYKVNTSNKKALKVISSKNLSGKYTIYLKINKILYKTDNYIKF